jgi:hypothetical protein
MAHAYARLLTCPKCRAGIFQRLTARGKPDPKHPPIHRPGSTCTHTPKNDE